MSKQFFACAFILLLGTSAIAKMRPDLGRELQRATADLPWIEEVRLIDDEKLELDGKIFERHVRVVANPGSRIIDAEAIRALHLKLTYALERLRWREPLPVIVSFHANRQKASHFIAQGGVR